MKTDSLPTTDLSPYSIYQHIEHRCNTHIEEMPPGQPIVILDDHWQFSRMAIIDEFVRSVLNRDDAAFVATTGMNGRVVWIRQPWVEPYFRRLTTTISPGMHEQFDVRNVFVELFLKACSELNILDWTSHILSHQRSKGETNAVAFNNLIVTIRRLAKQRPYPSKIWHAYNDWQRNFDSCTEFVANLYTKWSRYAVVRVDLAYRKEYAFDIFTKDARADLALLLKNIRRGKKLKKECRERVLFEDIAGYIWKLEYGTDRLLHFHCFFFFKNKNGLQAGHWAQEIGEYWIEVITKGRGTLQNCNYRWYGHPDEGVGEVNRKDTDKREKLLNAIKYLFKTDQALPIRTSDPRYRTFGKGMP